MRTLLGVILGPALQLPPALAEIFFPVLPDSAGSLAAPILLNGICSLVRALLDLPVDSGTPFPSLEL